MGTHSLLRHRHCASSERFTTSNMKVAFLLVALAALLAQSFGRNIFDKSKSMAHGWDISSSSDAYIASVKDALNQLEEDDCPLGDQLEKDDCPFPIGDQLEKDDYPFPFGDQLEEDDCPVPFGDNFYEDNHAAEATQHKALTNAAVTAFLNNKPKLKKVLEDGEAAREHVRKLVKEALKKAKEAGYSITHTPKKKEDIVH